MAETIHLSEKQKQEIKRHLEELQNKISEANHINVNLKKLMFEDELDDVIYCKPHQRDLVIRLREAGFTAVIKRD